MSLRSFAGRPVRRRVQQAGRHRIDAIDQTIKHTAYHECEDRVRCVVERESILLSLNAQEARGFQLLGSRTAEYLEGMLALLHEGAHSMLRLNDRDRAHSYVYLTPRVP